MKRKVPVILSMLLAAGLTAPALTVEAAPAFNPYKAIQAEAKFGDSGVEVTTEASGAKVVSSIDKGDYFFVKDVNFSEGLSKIAISAKAEGPAVIEVRKGGVDGEVLGNIKLSNTKGEYKDFSAAMKNVEGKDTIAFVGAGGSVSIDYWSAVAAQTTEPQPEDPQPENPQPENPETPETPENSTVTVNPYDTVEAESTKERSDAEDLSDNGVNYVGIKANGYLLFKDVDLSKGISGLAVTAKCDRPNTTLELHIDSVDGEALSSVKVSAPSAFKITTEKFTSDVTGTHDVYLVAKTGTVKLDSWKLLPVESANPDPQPENPQPEDPQPETPENPTTTLNPYDTVEAESAQDKYFAASLSKDGVNYLGIKANGYILFKDVDLSKGISGLMITAKSDRPNTSLELHVDSLDSEAVASLKVASPDEFKTNAVKFTSDITDKHDVYLVAKTGTVNLDSWKLMPGANVTPDPVTPDPVTPDPVNPDPVNPDPVNPDPVVTEGLNVRYQINSWGTGYTVDFFVDNKSGSTTNSWTVKVRKDQVSIDDSWCVNIKEEGDYYVITPLDWNSHIENGKSIQFGIIGTGSIGNTLDVSVQ